MLEVPLVFPNNLFQSQRYVVENKQLRRVEAPAGETNAAPLPPMEDALPGTASVSSLRLRGKHVIITTSARLENPDILTVALSWTKDALESPAIFELECAGLDMEALVAVRAFAENETLIRLVLVDSQGTFATITLTERFDPVFAPIQILRKMDYIDEIPVLQKVNGSEVQSNMVTFFSSTVVVLALAPFILTVDLKLEDSAVWSETQCLEDMGARTSSLKNIISNVSDLVLGKLEVGVMDMPTTAALCLTATANPLLDPTFCITMHSDASIRKWKIDPETSLLPFEVTVLNTKSLSLPASWSDMHNSVAICARLYEQTFALAVHIRTDGIYTNSDQAQRDCNLWVFHGNQGPDPDATCLKLTSPEEATALVGMNFIPTQSRCSLSVLFESAGINDRPATIQVTYPPSIMAILTTEPIIEQTESLDDIALTEQARIQSMMLGPTVMEQLKTTNVDEALHELDSLYIKNLFRPIFPRGTGTVLPPSETCIRRALAKMVHGHKKEPGMSIELETIRCVTEWRQRESRAIVLATTPPKERRSPRQMETETALALTSPFTVYESYVADYDEHDATTDGDMEEAAELQAEVREQALSSEVASHEKRWKRLLLQVWEEEQTIRLPLCVSWLEAIPLQVIVRAGITTAIEQTLPSSESADSTAAAVVLDGVAVRLLQRVEEDKKMAQKLYKIELELAKLIASANLATSPMNQSNDPVMQELRLLARWAWLGEDDDVDGISDDEHEKLEQAATSLSSGQLIEWITDKPWDASGTLGGQTYLGAGSPKSSNQETWNQSLVANAQLRHAACSFSVRCIDKIRRLQLGRCLLVLDLVEGNNAGEAALRAYLHTVCVLWTVAQRVPMPTTAFQRKRVKQVRLGESPDSSSPPNKRLSFGDDACGILAPHSVSKTTLLDVSIIEISQTMDSSLSLSSSPIAVAVKLGQSYFQTAFGLRKQLGASDASQLRELAALPRPKNESGATDYPRLALRLLAPCLAMVLPQDSVDAVTARKEVMAECLLIESHSDTLPGATKEQMRMHACELLVPNGSDYSNPAEQQIIRKALETLTSLGRSLNSTPVLTTAQLSNIMGSLVQTATAVEIARLCQLATVKKLFSPLAAVANDTMDTVTKSSIMLVANVMLHLSRIMHRIDILERHVGVRGLDEDVDNSIVLLDFISSAIKEIKKIFPIDFCHDMDEHVSMWSRLFHHSVYARHWKQAYAACVRNPKSNRRESNFKQLVRAMVDSGSLCELLNMCSDLVIPSNNAGDSVDLYGVASEILADAISRDFYTLRAASPHPSSLSDFQGALYALHVSQKQWRRAAQSMDLRYLNARMGLAKGLQESSSILHSAELRDGLIVEDIVLASVAALNSLELVGDGAHRFLVSGECGPYNPIPFDGIDVMPEPAMRTKRNRGASEEGSGDKTSGNEDRLSKFMTSVQLEGRAIRCSTLRALYFDRTSDRSYASAALLRDFATSKNDIDELFKNGYLRHGLLLAKAWAKNYDSLMGSTRPGGQGLFYDSLAHMIEAYLVPVCAGREPTGDEEMSSGSILGRPSVQQLAMALDDIGTTGTAASYVVPGRSCRIADLKGRSRSAAAMALTRKLTLAHSSADMPLAIDVAACFLEEDDGCGTIPTWLERLLTGADACLNTVNGLFARRQATDSATYLGDPAALVSLYSKHGMFAEACDIVSSVLEGLEGPSRREAAPSRLPEKGDIDFVPYQPIDVLWNLIEIALESGRIGESEANRIKEARDKMETALGKHFGLMKISEMGMKSARALRRSAAQ